MCGIAGLFDREVKNKSIIKKITDKIIHRGPDESGFYSNQKGFYLGMRRLSIIDLKNGSQPVETKNIVLIFNGEIFNFIELKNKYLPEEKNIKSDTIILTKLIDKIGFKILNDLKGFFSIAVYHKKKQKIFLIRDRFGIKPLYYFYNKSKFYFCSEIQPLRNTLHIHKNDLNIDQVNNYFVLGYIFGENRIYSNVKMLKAGTILEFDLKTKSTKLTSWFDIKTLSDIYISDNKKLVAKVYENIADALRYWARSDVEKVFALSGGLDSSILASIYSKEFEKVNTISFVYSDLSKYKRFSETENIKAITSKIKSNHEDYYWSNKDFCSDLDSIVKSIEEPQGNSLLPWFLYKKIKKNFKVCITGNGGDELFGNYNRPLNYLNKSLKPYDFENFKNNYFYKNYYFFNRDLQKKYLKNYTKDVSTLFYKILNKKKPKLDVKRNLSILDYQTQFQDDMLFLEDKLSMRNSVETRTPYLDHDLFKFIYSLKLQRINKNEYKHLLKKVGYQLLPKSIIDSKKKGFSMPLSLIMRNDLKNKITHYLSKKNLKTVGYINPDYFDDFVMPMLKGENTNLQNVWNVFLFHLWYDLN